MSEFFKLVIVTLTAVLTTGFDCGQSSAQNSQDESKSDAEQALIEKWKVIYDDFIDSIVLSHSSKNSDSTQSADHTELKRQTLLSIESPLRHGKVYLWTDRGRPIVIGAIFSAPVETMPARSLGVRFNSLTAGSVTGSRSDNVFWKCDDPGAKWIDGLTDLVPSNSRATRLIQMKSIVRQFECNYVKMRPDLLPHPLFRYPENTPGATDGAIFSFCKGTDPKVYLQIEAREDRWFMACYRDDIMDTTICIGDNVLWSFDIVAKPDRFQTEPFYFNYTSER